MQHIRQLRGVARQELLLLIQLVAVEPTEQEKVRAGPEGLVAPDPRGQGELIGAVVPRLVLAAQGRGGGQGRVLGPGEEGDLGEAGVRGGPPQGVGGGLGVHGLEGGVVHHRAAVGAPGPGDLDEDPGHVQAGGLGERPARDLPDEVAGPLRLVHHDDDLAGGAGDPLRLVGARAGRQAARCAPGPGGPRRGQRLLGPPLQVRQQGGGADIVAQAGRGEDVVLIAVGLEHDELHGHPLGGTGACAVCHPRGGDGGEHRLLSQKWDTRRAPRRRRRRCTLARGAVRTGPTLAPHRSTKEMTTCCWFTWPGRPTWGSP